MSWEEAFTPPSSPYPFLSLWTTAESLLRARPPFWKKPSVLSLPLAPRGATLGGDFEFPGSCGCAGSSWQGMGERLGPQPVTFSVDAQAPMVEPELTEVGELHSLTDWQVSEASEEAELDEFCSRGGATHHRKRTVIKNKKMGGAGGEKGTHGDRHAYRRGKDERSRGLGLFFPPKLHQHRGLQALERKHETQRAPDLPDCKAPRTPPSVCVPVSGECGQGAGLPVFSRAFLPVP